MSAENQQERPNYRIHFKIKVWDWGCSDWHVSKRDFHASNDDSAHKRVLEIKEENERENKECYERNPNSHFRGYELTPLKLERISYVIKEVEEITPVPMQNDALHRASRGEIVDLADLANM